jgi:hypothetical protein
LGWLLLPVPRFRRLPPDVIIIVTTIIITHRAWFLVGEAPGFAPGVSLPGSAVKWRRGA